MPLTWPDSHTPRVTNGPQTRTNDRGPVNEASRRSRVSPFQRRGDAAAPERGAGQELQALRLPAHVAARVKALGVAP
jgi:hypothetical protein